MKAVVLDASVALAWCFPDESNDFADTVLAALEGVPILVPSIWALEIANAITIGMRKRRIRQPEVELFVALLDNLPVVADTRLPSESILDVLPLASQFDLTAYDAAYLELALRKKAYLATLDKKLAKAAAQAGVSVFETG